MRAAALSIDAPGVIVSTCTLAQESDDIVLRMWNTRDQPARATVTPHYRIAETWLLNADESHRPERPGVRENAVTVALKPKEIVTLGLALSRT